MIPDPKTTTTRGSTWIGTALRPGGYCYGRPRHNRTYCSGWVGRSKLLYKIGGGANGNNKKYDLHGNEGRVLQYPETSKHFDTSEAHIKEWDTLFRTDLGTPTARPANSSFFVSTKEGVKAHGGDAGVPASNNRRNRKGTVVYHDTDLHDWFRFVASGCGRLYEP